MHRASHGNTVCNNSIGNSSCPSGRDWLNKQVNPSPEYRAAIERNEEDAPAVVKKDVQGVVGGKEHAEHTAVYCAPPPHLSGGPEYYIHLFIL